MPIDSQTLVSVQHVWFDYGRRPLIADVSLEVKRGDFVVLSGPNGGGKTTLLRLITGLLRPGKGRIERQRNLSIGYLPQRRSIDREFPITVREVVETGLMGAGDSSWPHCRLSAEAKEQTDDVMAQWGLTQLATQPIGALSGGQWQRTLLARAVVGNPTLLVLDEPDTHLDAHYKYLLATLLAEKSDDRAVVMVSHDDELLSHFPAARRMEMGKEEGWLID
ncbi:MAG: metal ABC transporter ATP-binding protein [Alloprevotella sp.]